MEQGTTEITPILIFIFKSQNDHSELNENQNEDKKY